MVRSYFTIAHLDLAAAAHAPPFPFPFAQGQVYYTVPV